MFPLPPHAGKHRLADDFFGKLLRRGEQEAPGRTFNPRVYLLGLRKVGIFSPAFFLSSSAVARLQFSAFPEFQHLLDLEGDFAVTELTPEHTLWPPHRAGHNRGHSIASGTRQNCGMPSNHTHHQRPQRSHCIRSITNHRTTLFQSMANSRTWKPPTFKALLSVCLSVSLFVCLFVCHRTRDGFSRHLPTLSVGAAPHKCEHPSHFMSFP